MYLSSKLIYSSSSSSSPIDEQQSYKMNNNNDARIFDSNNFNDPNNNNNDNHLKQIKLIKSKITSKRIHSGHFMVSEIDENDDNDTTKTSSITTTSSTTTTSTTSTTTNKKTGKITKTTTTPVLTSTTTTTSATTTISSILLTKTIKNQINNNNDRDKDDLVFEQKTNRKQNRLSTTISLSTKIVSIDQSLWELFKCMTLAYHDDITSPKWKTFKGLKMNIKEKIRLNNIIWRAWYIQYISGRKPVVCQFSTNIDNDRHKKTESILLEGKYWKRRSDVIKAEYNKWRNYYHYHHHSRKFLLSTILNKNNNNSNYNNCNNQNYYYNNNNNYDNNYDNNNNSNNNYNYNNYNYINNNNYNDNINNNTNNHVNNLSLDWEENNLPRWSNNLTFDSIFQPSSSSSSSSLLSSNFSNTNSSQINNNNLVGNNNDNLFNNNNNQTIFNNNNQNNFIQMSHDNVNMPLTYANYFDYANSRDIARSGMGADFMQPGLEQLQPNIDFIDQFEPMIQDFFSLRQQQTTTTLSTVTEENEQFKESQNDFIDSLFSNENSSNNNNHNNNILSKSIIQENNKNTNEYYENNSSNNNNMAALYNNNNNNNNYEQILNNDQQLISQPSSTSASSTSSFSSASSTSSSSSSSLSSSSLSSSSSSSSSSSYKMEFESLSSSLHQPQISNSIYSFNHQSTTNNMNVINNVNHHMVTSMTVKKLSTNSLPLHLNSMNLGVKELKNFNSISLSCKNLAFNDKNDSNILPQYQQPIISSSINNFENNQSLQNIQMTSNFHKHQHQHQQQQQQNTFIQNHQSLSLPSSPSSKNTFDLSSNQLKLNKKSINNSKKPYLYRNNVDNNNNNNKIRNSIIKNHSSQVMVGPLDYSSFKDRSLSTNNLMNNIFSNHNDMNFNNNNNNLLNLNTISSSFNSSELFNNSNLIFNRNNHHQQQQQQNHNNREKRRVGHINAEQKRRCNIKNGFDTLNNILPLISLNLSQNTKISKASMLHKAAEYIRILKNEKFEQQKEYESIKQKINELNNVISELQNQLPTIGLTISDGPKIDQYKERYKQYVIQKTQQNYKFWIFSIIMESLLESFCQQMVTNDFDELCKTLFRWLEQNCSLIKLRKDVLNSLRFISTSTNILSNPELLQNEILKSINQ